MSEVMARWRNHAVRGTLRFPPILAALILGLTASGTGLGGQTLLDVPDVIACSACRISVEPMFELGGPQDTTNIVFTSFLPMDSRGRFYYQSVYVPGELNVFDQRGEHVRTFGHQGEGPGEFTSGAALIVGPHDSLYAFGFGNSRLSVFSPEHEFIRSSPVEVRPHDGFVRADGSFVIASPGRTPATFGFPLHTLSSSGVVVESVGEEVGQPVSRETLLLYRRVTPGAGGGFFAAHRVDRYDIERRDASGRLQQTFRRRPLWFPVIGTPPRVPERAADPPPFPGVMDIQMDDDGRLWVLITVPAEDWQDVFPGDGTRAARHDLYNTIIEVIDLGNQTVVSRTRIRDYAIGFSGPGVFYTYDDSSVFDRLRVWRVSLDPNHHLKD